MTRQRRSSSPSLRFLLGKRAHQPRLAPLAAALLMLAWLPVPAVYAAVHGVSGGGGGAADRYAADAAGRAASGSAAEAAVERQQGAAAHVLVDEGSGDAVDGGRGDRRHPLLGEDLHRVAADMLAHIKLVAAAVAGGGGAFDNGTTAGDGAGAFRRRNLASISKKFTDSSYADYGLTFQDVPYLSITVAIANVPLSHNGGLIGCAHCGAVAINGEANDLTGSLRVDSVNSYGAYRAFGSGVHLIEAPVLVLFDVECNRVSNALGFACAQQSYPSTFDTYLGKSLGEIVMATGYMEQNTAAEGGAIYAQGDLTSTVRAMISDLAGSSIASYVPYISGLRGALDSLFSSIDGSIPADVRGQADAAAMIDLMQNGQMGIGSIQLLSGSSFASNGARGGKGGAICTAGNLLSFTTSDNANVASNVAPDAGGAFYVGGVVGQVVLSRAYFRDNLGRAGGAIYANDGVIKLQMDGQSGGNSPLGGNNRATESGGGIWAGRSIVAVYATDCTIQQNTGRSAGGAFYVQGNIYRISLTRASIRGNYATDAGSNGGAIFAGGFLGELLLDGSQMTGNSVSRQGGAIKTGVDGIKTVRLSGASFISGNTAGTDGGCIYTDGGVDTLELSGGSYVSQNTATAGAGGFLGAAGGIRSVSISGASYVTGNVAASFGGWVYAGGDVGDLALAAGSFATWNVAGSGGVLYAGGALGSAALTGSSYIRWNSALASGAVLYAGGKPLASDAAALAAAVASIAAIPAELSALPAMQTLNSTVLAGKAGVGSISLDASSVADNWAGRAPGAAALYGGGVLFSGGHVQSLQLTAGSVLRNNSAGAAVAAAGGALLVTGMVGAVSLAGASSVSDCSAGGNGGAVFARDGIAALTLAGASMLIRNSAGASGGALYAGGLLGAVKVQNASAVSGNSAGLSGGAAFAGAVAASITIEVSSSLSSNTAGLDGGAVAVGLAAAAGGSGGLVGPVVIRDGCDVSDNAAGRSGGVLHSVGIPLSAVPSLQTAIATSLASLPSDIANATDVVARVAVISGGQVGVQSLNITNNCRLHRNKAGTAPALVTATTGGGGVVSSGGHISSVSLSGASEIANCSAGGSGGVAYVAGVVGSLLVADTSSRGVSRCSAGLSGGVVYAADAVVAVTLNSTLLSDNAAAAGQGGVIATGGLVGAVDVVSSTVIRNAAGTAGGAIAAGLTVGSLTLRGASNVTDNAATGAAPGSGGDGGAVYCGGLVGTMTVTASSQLSRNRAARNGGAIYAGGLALSQLPAIRATLNSSIVSALPAELLSLPDVADVVSGILNASLSIGQFTLDPGSAMAGNSAAGGSGGAIAAGGHIPSLSFVPGADASANTAGLNGGLASVGGAVLELTITSSSSLVGSAATAGGGGAIHSYLGVLSLLVTNGTALQGCSAATGGSVYAGRMIGSLVVSNRSSISANRATGGPGGGVYAGLIGSLVITDGSAVAGNRASSGVGPAAATAPGDGGGVYSAGFIGALEVSHGSSINDNTARRHGGGVYAAGLPLQRVPPVAAAINASLLPAISGAGAAGAELVDSAVAGKLGLGSVAVVNGSGVYGNTAGTDVGVGGGIGSGGHIGSLLIRNSAVRDNTARQAGIAIARAHGGGMGSAGVLANATIADSRLFGNLALNGSGGALLGHAIMGMTITNSALYQNQADVGGVLCSYSLTYGLALTGCEVRDNVADSFGGVTYSGMAYVNVAMDSVQVLRNRAHPDPVSEFPDQGQQYPYLFNQLCAMIAGVAASSSAPAGFAVPVECYAGLGNLNTVPTSFRPALQLMIPYMATHSDEPLWAGVNITGGGGVFFTWGNIMNMVAVRSTFTDNTAARFGGIIACTGEIRTLEFSNSTTITGALANWIGGAVMAFRSITDLTLQGNTVLSGCAARWGGAIVSLLGFDRFRIVDNSHIRNSAPGVSTGGAILSAWTGYIYNLLISNNSGIWDNAATSGAGLLLDGDLVNTTIQYNSTIQGNNASESGGGMEVRGTIRNFTVEHGSSVRNNRAGFGGGIFCKQSVYAMTFQHNSSLELNEALESNGGGLLLDFGDGELFGFTLSNNSHVRYNWAGRDGGGINVRGDWPRAPRINGLTLVDRSTFTSNKAFVLGGGVFVTGSLDAVVISRGSGFFDNSANYAGGGIYSNSTIYNFQVTDGSALTNNSAGTGGGGAMAMSGDFRSVRLAGGSVVSSNRAAFFGGAIRVNSSVESLEVTQQSRVVLNSVTGAGGFLWVGGDVSKLSLGWGSALTGNSAEQQGGGVCVVGTLSAVVVAQSSVVSENSAGTGSEGGAFYALAGVNALDVTSGSTVIRNRAGCGGFLASNGTISGLSFKEGAGVTENSALRDAGGAVWSATAITDVVVRDGVGVWRNEAQERGGFAHSNGNFSDVTIMSSSIYSNRAGALGGVLSAAGTLRRLTLTEATNVHDNVVTGRLASGGVMSGLGIEDVAINGGSTLWANTATGNGGVMHCTKTLRRFNASGASRVFNNAAGGAGGVIFAGEEVTNLTLTGATSVTGNRARDGGVLACNGAVVAMRIDGASDVSANSATERAGAVFAGELQLTLTGGSSMRGHTANWGGTLYVQATLRALVIGGGSTLSNSKATDLGGAVYIFGGASSSNANSTAVVSSSNSSSSSSSNSSEVATAAAGSAERFGRASNVLITEGSNVTDVRAGGSGGFLYSYVGDITSFVVSGGSLVRNISTARGSGGVLSTGGGVGSLRVEGGSRLHATSADGRGGVAFAALGFGEVAVANTSAVFDVQSGSDGGVAATLGDVGRLSVTDASSVHDVRAVGNGGVVFAAAALGAMTVSGGSALRRCAAGLSGGAVFVGGPMQSLELTNSSALDSNTAGRGDGGCVAATMLLRLVVADSEVTNNRAVAAPAGAGGATGADGGRGGAGSGGCIFSGSGTGSAAGGGDAGGAMAWSVRRSRLLNNSAAGDGGALHMGARPAAASGAGGAALLHSLELSLLQAANNTAGGRGAGAGLSGRGGAVAVRGVCDVNITDTELVCNSAALSGGSIALWNPEAALQLPTGTAAGGTTAAAKLRRQLQQQDANTTTTTTATTPAAASRGSRFSASGLTVAHSTSWAGDGGAVFVHGADEAQFLDCEFVSCRADGDGGAVALVAARSVGFVRSSVAGSRAVSGRGGGLSLQGAVQVLLAASNITSNAAVQAGGVYVGPVLNSNASATIVAYDIRVNDNTAGRPRSGHAAAAVHPGFGGGLYIGHRNASVLLSGSDLGGNCAWLGAALVSLVRRSLDTEQLEATADAAAGMAGLLLGGGGGGGAAAGDVGSDGALSNNSTSSAGPAATASNVTELIAQANALMHSVSYAQQQSAGATAGGAGDGGTSSSDASSFTFMQNTSLQQPANPNNCSSFQTAGDLLPSQRQASAVWVDDLEAHGVFSDTGCGGTENVCLISSAPAGTLWLEGPAAFGTVLLLNRTTTVLRPGEAFSLKVKLWDAFNMSVSSVLERGAYNGTLMLLSMGPDAAAALLRDSPQLLRSRAAALDGTQTLACLPDTTVVSYLTDRYNASSTTTNTSDCTLDKAVAYLAATGEQGLTAPFEELGVLTWTDLALYGWPGGNYTLMVGVTGPSAVDPILLPLTIDGCQLGEFLQTAGSSVGASSSFDGNTTTTTAAAANRLALMSQAECVTCPRYQVGQVADPRAALAADASYPGSLVELVQSLASVSAACLECPENAICTGGRVVVPEPGYWHSSAFSLYMVRCPNAAACSLDPPEQPPAPAAAGNETTAGDGTSAGDGTAAGDGTSTGRPTISIASVAESLTMLSADDPRTTQLAMCQAWTFAGGNADPNATAYAPCALSDLAGETWRANELLRSIQADVAAAAAAAAGQRSVSRALLQLEAGAPGGPTSYMQQQCAEGYTGNLCAVCVDGYVLTSSGFECTTCPPNATAVTAIIGTAMLVVAVTQIMLLVTEHFKDVAPRSDGEGEESSDSRVELGDEEKAAEGGGGEEKEKEAAAEEEPAEPERPTFGEVWKLLISHFQQLLVIWQLDISFPPVITRFVNLMGASTTPMVSNPFVYLPVCLLPTHTPEQQARLSYLYELLMPFVSVALTIAVWFAGFWIARKYFWWWSIRRAGAEYAEEGASTRPKTAEGRPLEAAEQSNSPMHQSPANHVSFADLGGATEGDHSTEVFKNTRRSASYTVGPNPWAGMKPLARTSRDDAAAAADAGAPALAAAAPGRGSGAPDPWLRLGRQLYVVLLVAVFFEYPAWAGAALGTFACFIIDADMGPTTAAQRAASTKGYWAYNMNQECFVGEHASLFVPIGTVVLVLCCVAPPLWTLVAMLRTTAEQRERDGRVLLMHGFLYKSYKPQYYWYDSFMQLQLLGLVAIQAIGRVLLLEYQVLLMLVSVLVFAAINVLCRPLLLDSMTGLQFMSSSALAITITLSMYYVLGAYLHLSPAGENAIAFVTIAVNTIVALIYVGYALADVADILRHPLTWLAGQWAEFRAKVRKALLPLARCCGCAPKLPKVVRPPKLRPWHRAWWVDLHTPPRDGAGEDGWAAAPTDGAGGSGKQQASRMHDNPVALLDDDGEDDEHVAPIAHPGGRRMGWASVTAQRLASAMHRTFARTSQRRSIDEGGERPSVPGGGRDSMEVHDLHGSNRNSMEAGGGLFGKGKRRSLQLPGAPPKCAATEGAPSQGLHTAALLPSPTAAAAAASRASESGVSSAAAAGAPMMQSASARVPAALSTLPEEPDAALSAAAAGGSLTPARLASGLLSPRGAGSPLFLTATGAAPSSQRWQSNPNVGALADLDALVSTAGGSMYRSNSRGGAGLGVSMSGAPVQTTTAGGGVMGNSGSGEGETGSLASLAGLLPLMPAMGLGLRQGSVTEITAVQPPAALLALAASRPDSGRRLSRAGSTCGTPRRSTLAAQDTSFSGASSVNTGGGGGGTSVHGGGGGGGASPLAAVQLAPSPVPVSGSGLATSISVGGGQERPKTPSNGGGLHVRAGSALRRSQLRGPLTSALPFGAPPPLPVGPADDIPTTPTAAAVDSSQQRPASRMQPKGFLTATVTSGTVPMIPPAAASSSPRDTADGGVDDPASAGRRVHGSSTLTSALPYGAPPPLPPAPHDEEIEVETLLEKVA
ncbi:hypothetical protein HXX76_003965 [Chlamydomonas incerta]|uniref:Uncharacterized protein n=1 Tax=Chlamydomonas incerta TaxID=51695 RepID=A0A835T9I3_CHLIN|nr:hypothetical protein HXX76_003965 [Chlamydomonas incerta]|eukprot:KAG2441113.1 hypothetical protein HXX76_003965 [Chlamydomonas incerta]